MLARRSLPFEKALRAVKMNRMAQGSITTRGNQVTETNGINMVDSRVRFKIIVEQNFITKVEQHKVNISAENLKEVRLTNNSKLMPIASMTLIHLVVTKSFSEKYQMYHWQEGYLSISNSGEKLHATIKICQ